LTLCIWTFSDAQGCQDTVKLIDALELLKRPAPEGVSPLRVFLACGFTPLHFQTFLAAHLLTFHPRSQVEIRTGLFGDLAGSLERLSRPDLDAVAVVVEWQDLDPRLGIRSLGGWRSTDLSDIVESAGKSAARIGEILKQLALSIPVCVCFPTLPLPPLFIARPEQGGVHELQLREIVASLASAASGERGVRIVNVQRLDELSPLGCRFDVDSEIMVGFPYTLAHASIVAELLAKLVHNPSPKKGLITDLDDTLWAGILGEVGVDGLAWNMDQHAHLHGLYQQMLASLASAGILIGVASKNDPGLVDEAFGRKDLILPRDSVFPFEIRWDRKSVSVRRILETWNVGPESVVFIDDSPMEIAEVGAAFPSLECLLFPRNDYREFWELLKRLRELFGKSDVSKEDSLRLQSIRSASAFRGHSETTGGSLDDFLRDAKAKTLFTMDKQSGDARALELINKTNQFNLNGRRLNEAAWLSYLKDPATFLVTASYEDKFGPLGKIAVLLGKQENRRLSMDAWVMSCRAFSRRIEHQCLKYLFDKFGAESIVFNFEATPRNGPLQEFFRPWLDGVPRETFSLSKESFFEKIPILFHHIEEDAHEQTE
jgi:FkbH-like protein